MSYKVVALCLDYGPQDVTETLLMVALAENADDAGYSWPGVERLAARCRRSKRQVLRLLEKLAVRGWISIHPRAEGFGKKQTAYQFNMLRLSSTFSGDIQVSHQNVHVSDSSTTSQISSDAQMTPRISSDISGGSQVTFAAISGDISASLNKRNHRTVEPSDAGAPERVIVYGDEEAQAPPPKTKRPELVKPKPSKDEVAEQDQAIVEAIYAAYPAGCKTEPEKTMAHIRAKWALLTAGKCLDVEGKYMPKKAKAEAAEYLLARTVRFAEIRSTQDRQYTVDSTRFFSRARFVLPENEWYDRGKQPSYQRSLVAPVAVGKSVLEQMAEQRSGTR